MKLKFFYFVLIFFFGISYAQDNINNSKVKFDNLQFKNINKYPRYVNNSKLKTIMKLKEDKKWEELYIELKDYVKEFGIQNFYKDTKYIWRLAKLTELFGSYQEAQSLYRLVLRHHHEDININELEIYYDSLNTQQTELFVPLEYYYKLIEHRKNIDTIRPPRGVLLNMGPKINSRKSDYAPTLNIDDNILLFTSDRNETFFGFEKDKNEDIFISRLDEFNEWTKAEELKIINSTYNEGSAYFSHDKKTIYFSRCSCPECFGDCDLFSITLGEDSIWGNIENLGMNVNSVSWDSHPTLSSNDDTLFFASDRLGGFGLSDIYMSVKDKNGNWQQAKNLGPIINTRQNDLSPFFHTKHNVLYFSSNGQLFNFGNFDIFKSYYRNEQWSEPQNIGPLVNTKGSEFYFTIDSKSNKLYYARSASGNISKLDIYSFPLPMEAQPGQSNVVTGRVSDSDSNAPAKGIVSIIDLDAGIEVAPKYLKPDGTFEFELLENKNYLLVVQGDDFFRIEEAFNLNKSLNLDLKTIALTAKVKFKSIEFENEKSDLTTEMYADLNKVVNFLYDNIDFKLKIYGHTDSDGNEAYNLILSKERAKNIRDYIVIFAGVHESRVEWEGYGSSQPIVTENTDEDKAINRRVEFEIYRPKEDEPIKINDDFDDN